MKIGVPKECLRHEHRVGLTPYAVSRLSHDGHDVLVEQGAGADCHFRDEDFVAAGAAIVYSGEEVCGRSDLLCRVSSLSSDEITRLRPGTVVVGFLHLAVMPRDLVARLVDHEVTMIGYEIIEDPDGRHPVRMPLSEIAGHVAVHKAAHLLEHESGGRGLILGGVPGVPPATVVVIGAGTVGRTAARMALALGAHVIVLDADLDTLRSVTDHGCRHAVTVVATPRNLARFTAIADVLIGAVLVPGGRTPYLVTEEMVRRMKPGSVILDLSIDQGGCVETSRPTSPDSATFRAHGVTHYCVPNMTANVPRTASRALSLAAAPFLERIANAGLEAALAENAGLAKGLYMYRGKLVHEAAARALGVPCHALAGLLP